MGSGGWGTREEELDPNMGIRPGVILRGTCIREEGLVLGMGMSLPPGAMLMVVGSMGIGILEVVPDMGMCLNLSQAVGMEVGMV